MLKVTQQVYVNRMDARDTFHCNSYGLYSLPLGRNKRNVGLLPSGSFHKPRQDLNLKK